MKEAKCVADVTKVLDEIRDSEPDGLQGDNAIETLAKGKVGKGKANTATAAKKETPKVKKAKSVPTPSVSIMDDEDDDEELSLPELSGDDEEEKKPALERVASSRQSGRARGGRKSYAEDQGDKDVE